MKFSKKKNSINSLQISQIFWEKIILPDAHLTNKKMHLINNTTTILDLFLNLFWSWNITNPEPRALPCLGAAIVVTGPESSLLSAESLSDGSQHIVSLETLHLLCISNLFPRLIGKIYVYVQDKNVVVVTWLAEELTDGLELVFDEREMLQK